jgi:hypothetical protein
MKLPRRTFLQLSTAAAALSVGSSMVWAEAYPARSYLPLIDSS